MAYKFARPRTICPIQITDRTFSPSLPVPATPPPLQNLYSMLQMCEVRRASPLRPHTLCSLCCKACSAGFCTLCRFVAKAAEPPPPHSPTLPLCSRVCCKICVRKCCKVCLTVVAVFVVTGSSLCGVL